MKLLTNKFFLIAVSVVVFLGVVFALMPRPIGTNLEKVGNGQMSVVFVYDPNLAVSNEQTIEINKARDIIRDEANFLVVQIGDPSKDGFKRQHQVSSSDVLFFSGDGELVDRQVALLSAEELIKKLQE